MALSNHAGFSARSGAALSTDLGQALVEQISRFLARFTAATPASTTDGFAGPSFEQLSPGLVNETRRG